jgi:pimeloyl-ACP methyl ester carboxylesterase
MSRHTPRPPPARRYQPAPKRSGDQHRLCYVDTGPRESARSPFLLVHGLGASLNYWAAIIPELSADRRVVAVDIPGFGDSPALAGHVSIEKLAQAIAEFAGNLNLIRPVVVGHSLGGLLALEISRQSDTERVVLVDGHLVTVYELVGNPRAAVRYPKLAIGMVFFLCGLLIPFRGAFVRILARSKTFRVLLFSYLVARPAELDPDLLRVAFAKTSNRGIFAALRAMRQADIAAVLDATKAPTDVAWGTDDPLLLERDHVITKRLLHPESLHRIPVCGHWPMLERPAEVLRILKAAANDHAIREPG